jgi:hypothetical protein
MRSPTKLTWVAIGVAGVGLAACGGSDDAGSGGTAGSDGSGGQATGGSAPAKGGSMATGGSSAGGKSSTGGSVTSGGATNSGGAVPTGGTSTAGGTTNTGGDPGTGGYGPQLSTHCSSALPAGAKAADVSNPTKVGTGTAASCTFDALNDAVKKGGVITFDCGPDSVTIAVTSTLMLPTNKDTVIDGGNRITLDGQHAVQILKYNSGNWMALETRVTLQHLTLIGGKTTPKEAIPKADPPCSQGFNDGEGGALYMRDGNLTVVDCTFDGNDAAQLGPDTGGGAIYITGSKHGAIIVGSSFTHNSAANAGAVGALFAQLEIYDSLFQNNTATGNGANNNDAKQCPDAMNNGQNEVGSGGNGGAIYQDGGSATNVILCGDTIADNKAGTGGFGGGVFMTSNDFSGTMTVKDSSITGNTGGSWTTVKQGNTNLGSAFGVNAKSATIENSTLQGK